MTTTANTINGNEGNNRLTGTSRNDVINGNGGNDRLSGGSGDDTLNGGAGKDKLNGGSGNDVLDGGSGSDELEGGSGNDTFIYTLGENNVKGTYDEYDGGSGSDTLELRFTRAEWMNTSYQEVLQSYLKWASKSGSSCRWDDDFTFKFGNARLEIEDIEKLVVKVDDVEIINAGKNRVTVVDDGITITEDEAGIQTIKVLDNDIVGDLVKNLELLTNPTNGTVKLVKPESTKDNANTWYFEYTPDSIVYQSLNTGEFREETFTYRVTDANGDVNKDPAKVTITIKGVNDAADITFTTPDQLIEDDNLKSIYSDDSSSYVDGLVSTGTITIQDKDRDQSELLKIDAQPGNLGTLKTELTFFVDSVTNQVTRSDIAYTYSVENSKVQYLAKDKIKEEKFTIFSVDGTTQEIVFKIKGVDDVVNTKPEIEGKGRVANVKELINLNYENSTIKSYAEKGGDYDYLHIRTGHFYVKDIDVDDSITLETNNYIIDGYLGKFTPTFTGIKTDGKYLVTWKYEVNDSKLEPLTTPTTGTHSKDQTYTLKFKSGADTLTADVVIHLDGRDDINFTKIYGGNNVFIFSFPYNISTENPGNDVLYFSDDSNRVDAENGSDVIYTGSGIDTIYLNADDSIIFSGDGNDQILHYYSVANGLIFGGNGNDQIIFNLNPPNILSENQQKIYTWGGEGVDQFVQFKKTTTQIGNWVMDFNASNPTDGGDKISYREDDRTPTTSSIVDHIWNPLKTQLLSHTADTNHPYLSDGVTYYELRVQSSVNSNDLNWYSVLNLVGINGAEITVDGLFANKNLVLL
jgi:VCBS repeat-containing protein